MNAMNAAVAARPPSLTATRVVTGLTTLMVGLVVVLWGAIAMQGPPGNPYGPPQGGGYQSPPQNPYGAPPGPRAPPPPEEPPNVPPEPPTGSSSAGGCAGVGCDACFTGCDATATSCVIDALCESLSLCDLLSACSTGARAGRFGLAFAQLLVPIAVLAAWRKRERRRESAA